PRRLRLDDRPRDPRDRGGLRMTQRTSRAGSLATHAFLVLVTVATLYPLMLVARIALTPGQGFSASLNPLPDFETATLDNFRAVVTESTPDGEWLFGHQLLNSVVISLATTVLGIFLATTAAYAFSRFRFP